MTRYPGKFGKDLDMVVYFVRKDTLKHLAFQLLSVNLTSGILTAKTLIIHMLAFFGRLHVTEVLADKNLVVLQRKSFWLEYVSRTY